jgi:predicted nucleic acid-binding protein
MIVVSNTSPISNLAAIGQLELLQQLYGNIIIPPAVYQELINSGDSELILNLFGQLHRQSGFANPAHT